jgi:hypothetical protein
MARKVLILAPRLDCTFKQGPVPDEFGDIAPIRVHWMNFINGLVQYHKSCGDEVTVLLKALWQFSPEETNARDADIVYIPHKEPHNFPYAGAGKAYYYMQTVFPELFTIDENGWGANLSYLPLELENAPVSLEVMKLRERAKRNISKFDQPTRAVRELPWDDYILFVCQIPHDEVIKHHSTVSVEQALEATLKFAHSIHKRVIVKGHPVNPASMAKMRDITFRYTPEALYLEQISIHDVLQKCEAAFMVNSGVGFEAMLHNKPIFAFGRSEYQQVVNNVTINPGAIAAQYNLKVDQAAYDSFLFWYLSKTFNTAQPGTATFRKLG